MFERKASIWDWSAGYTRTLPKKWSFSSTLAFDQENERTHPPDNPYDKIINTFIFVGTANYLVTNKFSLSTGIARGFVDDDNQNKQFEFADGDWTTGIAAVYNLLDFSSWTRDSFNLSTSLEYNIAKNEWMLSVDLGFGIAF